MSWFNQLRMKATRRLLASVVAIGATVSLATYEFAKPASAAAPTPAPAASALDDNSVSALLALDHAMETVAARVTPATVNVTVTSRTSPDNGDASAQDNSDNGNDNDDSNGPQQFFGPFGFNKRFFQMQPQQPEIEHGLGSGVIISPDGYIVTNNHVVDGATDIRVTLHDRRILPAKLIGRDKLTDLAVVKVNASDLPSVPCRDSTKLQPGETVLAFDNPLAYRFTVTRGRVGALNRPNPAADRRAPG